MAYRILVTGSRNFSNRELLKATLDLAQFRAKDNAITLIHGDARGLDTLAGQEANNRGWNTEVYPANWKDFGRKAGPLRNQVMVDAGANICLAFPTSDSIGTWDCIRRAKTAQIPVMTITSKKSEPTRLNLAQQSLKSS